MKATYSEGPHGYDIIPMKRVARIRSRPRRVSGNFGGGSHSRGNPLYKSVEQVQINEPYSAAPKAIHIRTGYPIKAYIPKDPGRADRLLAANAEINRARAEASRSGDGRLHDGPGETGGGVGH